MLIFTSLLVPWCVHAMDCCQMESHLPFFFPSVSGATETKIVSQGRFQVLERELLITNALKEDSGQYRCSARNIKGNITADAHLQVISKSSWIAILLLQGGSFDLVFISKLDTYVVKMKVFNISSV